MNYKVHKLLNVALNFLNVGMEFALVLMGKVYWAIPMGIFLGLGIYNFISLKEELEEEVEDE